MAIEYGMTSKEFWEDDPNLFVSYRTSFINKKKREMEEINYTCWLMGAYNFDGNSKIEQNQTISISRMLGGKAHYSKDTYPSKPYDLANGTNNSQNKKQTKEEQRQIMQKQYEQDCIFFSSIKQRFIDSIKEGE